MPPIGPLPDESPVVDFGSPGDPSAWIREAWERWEEGTHQEYLAENRCEDIVSGKIVDGFDDDDDLDPDCLDVDDEEWVQ